MVLCALLCSPCSWLVTPLPVASPHHPLPCHSAACSSCCIHCYAVERFYSVNNVLLCLLCFMPLSSQHWLGK